jgi:ribosomal-protein-alanine acetyltransferase
VEKLIRVRPAAPEHLEDILAIQSASPEASQWPREEYVKLLDAATVPQPAWFAWVAQREGKSVGFLVASGVADEMEILNLAVAAKARRSGVGSALLAAALTEGADRNVATVFLEVRESNDGAVSFYRRHGFQVTRRRSRYYSNPEEDALVLSRTVAG